MHFLFFRVLLFSKRFGSKYFTLIFAPRFTEKQALYKRKSFKKLQKYLERNQPQYIFATRLKKRLVH
jgi:hypothetical protein